MSQTFAPVIRLTSFPNIIVVNPSIGAGSLRVLVNLAKAKPGTLTHAAAGVGSGTSLLGALLKSVAGIDMLEVHYKSPGAEMPDLLSGHVQVAFAQLSVVGQHLRSRKLRALAVTSSKRITALPDISTTAEAGLPEVAFTNMSGILVLAGTARPIILQLHQHLAKIINDPDFKDQVIATGGEIGGESPEEFAAYLRAESAKWGKLIKANGIKME